MATTRRMSDRQKAVIEVMRMHLQPQKALLYLKNEYNIRMADRTLRKWKQRIRETSKQRLYQIAQYGFEEEQIESIDEIEIARKLLWKEYRDCKNPVARASILEKIINTRPLLSSYYDSTKEVIEKPVANSVQKDSDIQITEPTAEWT